MMSSDMPTQIDHPKNGTDITAIVSGKGGTGKSLISCCISYVLANCGFKVLLVDTDLFTAGLTFFVGSLFPRRVEHALWDVMIDDCPVGDLKPIIIPDEFCRRNLFFLPAVSQRSISPSELDRHHVIDDLSDYVVTLRKALEAAQRTNRFDYIILDTRGGSDVTSIGAAVLSDGFIVVTEADKTSWEVGGRLLDAIDASGASRNHPPLRLGFLINKNVLPDEAIIQFLRHQWRARHLATIPLDEGAIRYFQEDKVPVAEEQTIPFSEALIPIVRKVFVDERWKKTNLGKLENLEHLASQNARERAENESRKQRIERLSFLLRAYAVALALVISVFLSVSGRYILDDLRTSIDAMIGIVTLVLAIITIVDSRVLSVLLQDRRKSKGGGSNRRRDAKEAGSRRKGE